MGGFLCFSGMLLANFGPVIGGFIRQLIGASRPMSPELAWIIVAGVVLAGVGFSLERQRRRSQKRLAQERAKLT